MSLDVNISEPDEFNCVELHTIIKDVASLINADEFEYNVEYLSEKGDNYVANLFRLTVSDLNEDNSIKVIVKTLINSNRQELFHELHGREVFVYNEVIPKFQSILRQYYKDTKFDLAKCYMSCAEPGKEVIILEDLLEKGFQMDHNKYESVDLEQAGLIFRKLAKFHALSFILDNKDPVIFERLKYNCKDIIFDDIFITKSRLKDYFTESFNASTKAVIDERARKILMEKVSPNIVKLMKHYVEPKKYSVLCHGDFWINNILFKNEESKPVDVIFLDFQAMRYANPVTDIMYFAYLCTDSTFRAENFKDLQNLYYNTLKNVLSNCAIDINIAYPRKAFDDDLEEFTNFGLICAMTELRMMTVKPENECFINDLQVGLDTDAVIDELKLYSLRVNQLVTEFTMNGYLDKL